MIAHENRPYITPVSLKKTFVHGAGARHDLLCMMDDFFGRVMAICNANRAARDTISHDDQSKYACHFRIRSRPAIV